jgi:ABC-type molybdate transport system substrate-binding protein
VRLAGILAALLLALPAAAEPVRLAAAGSLGAALAEVAKAFERAPGGGAVTQTYAPSGLLRQRIAGGEPFEVLASANMEHPEAVGRERNRPTGARRDAGDAAGGSAPGFELSPDVA